MALLDKKERILDVVLTDKGRELLSKNKLRFSYYAFSDAGIDYSGSFTGSVLASSSFDNYINRGLAFEVPQYKSKTKLDTYLYTIDPSDKVLPDLKLSVTGSVTAERRFYEKEISSDLDPTQEFQDVVDIVIRAKVPKEDAEQRQKKYVLEQRLRVLSPELLKKLNK